MDRSGQAAIPNGVIEMKANEANSRLQVLSAIKPLGVLTTVLFIFLLLLPSCTSPTAPDLEGGILVTFDVHGERYRIFITNTETIDQVFALSSGQSNATIPTGKLLRGRVSYNLPWHWHIDSDDIQMAENTIELCDGLPSHVEADIDYWVDQVGRFCPWSAVLVSIKDYR